MKSLRIYPSSVNSRYIAEAVDMLRKGELIIYPTDTLYAIACSALNQGAIEKLCRFKNIDSKKQTLSIVCADISQASEYARIDNIAYKLLRTHCPGAYTFILPAATTLPKAFKGRHTVGVCIPDDAIARALAEELGHPLLTSSLPMPDHTAPGDEVTAEELAMLYSNGPADLMIDGGHGQTVPSTIVDITDSTSPEIIRDGAAPFPI